MKTAAFAVALSWLLSGCANLTPKQEKYIKIGAGILIVGAIVAHSERNDTQDGRQQIPTVDCVRDPESCR